MNRVPPCGTFTVSPRYSLHEPFPPQWPVVCDDGHSSLSSEASATLRRFAGLAPVTLKTVSPPSASGRLRFSDPP